MIRTATLPNGSRRLETLILRQFCRTSSICLFSTHARPHRPPAQGGYAKKDSPTSRPPRPSPSRYGSRESVAGSSRGYGQSQKFRDARRDPSTSTSRDTPASSRYTPRETGRDSEQSQTYRNARTSSPYRGNSERNYGSSRGSEQPRDFSKSRTGASNFASSRDRAPATRFGRTAESVESSSTPRHLRRVTAFSSQRTSAVSASAPPKYRSKHYDPAKDTGEVSELRKLEPHILSGRLKALCEAGKLDDAVSMLKNAPLDAQNTVVWNTLIWECMKTSLFSLAFRLYTDMKRRGFSPNTRTFSTMFNGLSKIEHWATYTKQIENAHTLFEGYQRHVAAVKQDNPGSDELSVAPIAPYFKVLGDNGLQQKMFDIYYDMDKEGPLAPNQFVYTAMFRALHTKRSGLNTPAQAQNAASAKLLWTQLLKASKRNGGVALDSFVVSEAMLALARGRAADVELAFGIARDYFGLTARGEPPVTGTPPLALKTESLAAVLVMCTFTKRFEDCIHIFEQVKKRPEPIGGISIVDRKHAENVLHAQLGLGGTGVAESALDLVQWMLRQEYVGKNGPKIRPAKSTFDLVLQLCWRDADWRAATRTFDLMTGFHSHDFMDGVASKSPRLDERSPGRNITPDAETMSTMLRVALATKNLANMRTAMRLTDHILGATNILRNAGTSTKAVKRTDFFATKLASALLETANNVLGEEGSKASAKEIQRWQYLADGAKKVLRDEEPRSRPATRPTGKTTYRRERDHSNGDRENLSAYEMSLHQ